MCCREICPPSVMSQCAGVEVSVIPVYRGKEHIYGTGLNIRVSLFDVTH